MKKSNDKEKISHLGERQSLSFSLYLDHGDIDSRYERYYKAYPVTYPVAYPVADDEAGMAAGRPGLGNPGAIFYGGGSTMSEQRLIGEFEKNSGEMIRVHMVERKAQTYVDIRVWYRKEDATLQPTTRGLMFNAGILSDLRSAIEAARKAVQGGVEILQVEPARDNREGS
jgi:hypothetical protein